MSKAGAPGVGAASIGLEFDALRGDGIAMLQRLCGDLWTDYNLHDPGVTTLELLVYSLSDLAFRTDFDMADYLTGVDGTIDFARQGLYEPASILSCEALTVNDYRRLLYEAVPEVADIWVRLSSNGLMAIDIMTDAQADAAPGARTLKKIVQVYAAHRSLGEDVASVRLISPRPYYLCGKIDTYGERSAAEILAQILFDCGNYLSSGMAVQRLRDIIEEGHSPDQVFEGPAMGDGYVTASEAGAAARSVSVSELIGVIQKITGVRRVRALKLVDADQRPYVMYDSVLCDSAQGSYPSLPFPSDEVCIELLRLQPEQGIEDGVSEQLLSSAPAWRARNRAIYKEGALEFHKLHFERRTFRRKDNAIRSNDSAIRSCYSLPIGRHRNLSAYYSIQNEFPEVYGINQYGLPHGASAERKTQAQQLKAFLYPFEQLMANFLQNLQELPILFSASIGEVPSTYHSQFLGMQSIPQIEELYALTSQVVPTSQKVLTALRTALDRQDDYNERKGRLYDYLLALYGEAFPQTALRRFAHYHGADTEGWLLGAKQRLIVELVELGAGRGRGFNYLDQSGETVNLSPLQRRIALMVGFDDDQPLLTPSWADKALTQIDDNVGDSDVDDDPALAPGLLPLPTLADADRVQPLTPSQPWPIDAWGESAFRHGAVLSNYRLGREGDQIRLYCLGKGRWLPLGSYGETVDAVRAAHASVALLITLHRKYERMHLVEHILLRPRDPHGVYENDVLASYAARISLVLPRWTLRCADSDFRNFVEQTAREHCPAHLHASFLWLGPALMAQFEGLQNSWQHALSAAHASDDAQEISLETLDQAALALVTFLQKTKADPT